MADLKNNLFLMRTGGFGDFPKGKVSGPETYLGPPPPEKELDLVGAWVVGDPWNHTGYNIKFPFGKGLSEQEMMDLEISYSDSADSIRVKMEFPALPADPEAADAFKAMSELLRPKPDAPQTPGVSDLIDGFAASLGEVIRQYAPKHAIAIGSGKGQFVYGNKLGPALQAFAGLLVKTAEISGDPIDLPASEGVGAYFIAPNRAIDLKAFFDRAAFRSLMMGETVPRALGVAMFEVRHSMDERLAGTRLSAEESWAAMIKDSATFFLSPDRDLVGRMGAEILEARKPAVVVPEKTAATPYTPSAAPADLWNPIDDENVVYDEDDPANFGL